MVTARSTPNIALIKYWGNRNDELRLPMADSVSITLDSPGVEVSIEHSPVFSLRSYLPDGTEKILKEKDSARIEGHLNLTKNFLATINRTDAIPQSVSITIHSAIPPAIGIASSAAVFSALAKAYAGLISGTRNKEQGTISERDISIIARLGSGSAARSIFGGFVALSNQQPATSNAIASASAAQIAPESHWPLFDTIIVPTMEEKKVGSTEGHHLAHTSPHFKKRIEAIGSHRQQECIDAILAKDFEKLQAITEEDCWDMHNVMQTQTPPLQYLNDETYRIVDEITELREREHLPVLYTMDAGPTVHLICTKEAVTAVREYAHAQKNCTVFEAGVGKGTEIMEN
jgi:diphosphomevalonate decarboxylase